MKSLMIIIAAGCMLAFSVDTVALDYNPFDKVIQEPNPEQDTLVFTVYGMDCPGCAGGLVKQVEKIESVDFAEAFWSKQELKIVLKENSVLDLEELEKRVKKSNFTLAKDSEKKKKDEK